MFGTDEPKLRPLTPRLRAWAAAVTDRVSPTRLRSDVEAMPAPRNRLHSSVAMAQADDLIVQSFNQAGWVGERRPFDFTRVLGFLDYPDRGFDAGAAPKIYRHLAGVNLLAIKEGLSSREVILVGAHHDTIRIVRHISPGADDFGRSDHVVFWENNIPAIMISDTANFRNPHYHQPTDRPDTLDYDHLAAIVGATAIALAQLAGVID